MKIKKRNSRQIWTQTEKAIKDDCIRFSAENGRYWAMTLDYFKQEVKAKNIIII